MNFSSSVRERLRDATNASHAGVDACAGRMRVDTSHGYARFLSTQASVVFPLEDALERAGVMRVLPDWRERRRSEALSTDLGEIGANCIPMRAPVFESDAALLGAAYVLEGSRLGARIILSRVSSSATRYLRHGEGCRLWPTFLDVLESNEDVRRHPEAAEYTARLVFAMFAQAMERQDLPQDMAMAS
jgi:heme oxygenase